MKKNQVTISILLTSYITITTGCASIVTGHNQTISVNTKPAINASCALANKKGRWYIPNTPGTTTITRSYDDLHVICEKNGYPTLDKKVKSSLKAITIGNILFGGVIGAGVDVATGAAYDYPPEVFMPMEKA